MKLNRIKFLAMLFPIIFFGAQLEPALHLQIDPQDPQHSSYMKFSGTIYDKIPETNLYWVINPKIYLHPTVPADFSTSIGLKMPVSSGMAAYHLFGHFHNFGYWPVNQFGHTLEYIHDRFEARLNYYHPAIPVYPFSTGIQSNHRIETHFTFKNSDMAITGGPIYHLDETKWGYLGRLTFLTLKHDYGVEINKTPGNKTSTAFFINFKFSKPKKASLKSQGNDSCHYTNLILNGPLSFSHKDKESKKFCPRDLKSIHEGRDE